ncbi:UvrD-helicase domain-containing protein [Streptomyces sp. CNQ085]|uniref:UvrD-helicase domain-containing protein n=1 Tax=Streptomyces sp. CNQ085 TaxID=2886944 RepID=UPI001F507EB5|nr:UvrD-helicase domain-containing protein [Streptomyces sp. CNQ085]MCI0384151.1 AAA family ATPase [Streptomyces sp. CNQ085]
MTTEAEDVTRTILTALREGRHFKVEAGAGAGKTSSLIEALQSILADQARYLPWPHQRVACVTYTNVARDEIISRTDRSPYVFAETIHGFLWQLLSPFRKHLLRHIVELNIMPSRMEGRTSLDGYTVEYSTGFQKVDHDTRHVRLGHNDLPVLARAFFALPKFRALAADRFPIVFVDEYQDTPAGLAEAMLGTPGDEATAHGPLCGFFGDHWQQIYENACGALEDARPVPVFRRRNRRSQRAVVNLLNTMRPELAQTTMSGAGEGTVAVYHTNEWAGTRLTHHRKGQLGWDAAHAARRWVLDDVRDRFWSTGAAGHDDRARAEEASTKILMLTHETIAGELGYQKLHGAFRYNDSYVKKEDHAMAFFMDTLEPALLHYRNKHYGAMFDALDPRGRPPINSPADKQEWMAFLAKLEETRETGTVGDVLDLCLEQRLFDGLGKVRKRHREAVSPSDADSQAVSDDKAKARAAARSKEYQQLRKVPYAELLALNEHLGGGTPFATQHGVKGLEFTRVLAVVSKGHNLFQIPEMLANFSRRDELVGKDLEAFVRARNLFYVACSRAREHLAILFTTRLEPAALGTLREWVGESRITSLRFDGDTVVGGE